MAKHNFEPVFEHYPELVAQITDIFTSHDFILHLAWRYQSLYFDALYIYRNIPNLQHAAPFKTVHGILAKHLNAYSQLVTHIKYIPVILA